MLALILNEIDAVEVIPPQIQTAWHDRILVLDGDSADGTIEWCRNNGHPVYVQQRRGIRFAYVEVSPMIIGDIVLTISPDCLLEGIPELIAKVNEGYDLAIGSPYRGEAHSDDDDFLTCFGNRFFTKTINLLRSGHYTDAMVSFGAFRKTLDLRGSKQGRVISAVRKALPHGDQLGTACIGTCNQTTNQNR